MYCTLAVHEPHPARRGIHIEITTPFLDRHNDRLQIYATKSNGHFALTDDGYVIQDLQSSGCELKTKKRRALLETTLNGCRNKGEDRSCGSAGGER